MLNLSNMIIIFSDGDDGYYVDDDRGVDDVVDYRYMHKFIPMHLSVYEFNERLKGRKSARYHKGREKILQGWLCFSVSRLRQQS
jgi:hypothetical protein